jgi:hypothetical protein
LTRLEIQQFWTSAGSIKAHMCQREQVAADCSLWASATCSRWFLARGLFYPEYGGDKLLRNIGSHKIYTAPHLRRRYSSWSPPWKPQILQLSVS